MSRLSFDSPLSRRIVRSFLRFLDSVELAPGSDNVGLEVAKECLAEAFKIDGSSTESQSNSDSLVDIFTSWDETRKCKGQQNVNDRDVHAKVGGSTRKDFTPGMSIDDLFGQYVGALERIHYFRSMPDGSDDIVQLDRIASMFHRAVEEMQQSGNRILDQKNLAETFKLQGNKAMQVKLYMEAIELYTFGIALCEDNAVYYCNRAAAYTQIQQYERAKKDCLKSIQIDPHYSKAYSRLGFAYYAEGKYRDAIDKGFMKALSLDPNNESAKQNIRMAEDKLKEQLRSGYSQSSSAANHHAESNNGSAGQSGGQPMPPPFVSMQFDSMGLPVDIAGMLRNMGTHIPGPHPGSEPNGSSNNGAQSGGVGMGPVDIAEMLRNMGPNIPGQHPGSNATGDGAHGSGGFGTDPVDIAEVLRNMGTNIPGWHPGSEPARNGSQSGEGVGMGAVDPAEMLRNMGANLPGQHPGSEPNGDSRDGAQRGEGVGMGGQFSYEFGEQTPEELSGALRSIMDMFSGAAPHVNPDSNSNSNGR